jgi:CRP-like cAMP-binding protein
MRKVLYLLGELTDADAEWLVANGTRQAVPVGAAIIEEGKDAAAVYIVLDGVLSATVAALGGQEVERLVCGAVIGEMSFIDGRPPSATVRARAGALVLGISRNRLAAKLEVDTAFAARFYKAIAIFLSDRLRGKLEMLGSETQLRLDAEIAENDELNPALLNSLYLAGQRFDRMLRQLMGG